MTARGATGSANGGAVAAGHPATAAAAREILRDRGNAFDAALAAMCAACVAEPVLCSLGGGGFMLARRADGGAELHDFFVSTPQVRRPTDEIEFYPIQADFGPATQEFHIGLGAIATPGLVKGLFAVHRALCSLPMARLVEPAIRLAREGFRLRPVDAYLFQVVGPVLSARPAGRAVFGHGDGGLFGVGEVLRQPDLALALEALAREGQALFYEGEIGRALVADCAAHGGQVTARDLADYRVARRRPLAWRYRDARVLFNPPPSSGGILVAFALGLLESRDPLGPGTGAGARAAMLAEVMTLTNRARLETASGDARGNPEQDAAARLLDPALLARYAREIKGRPPSSRGTTHISVADAQGNVAALTLSNGEGCGHILPGTGIMMNNMLGEEDLNPGGFHAWREGTRMTSMMCPSIAERADGSLIALGTGGSNRIRTATLQVLVNLLDRGLDLGEAIEAPRLHVEAGVASLEEGYGEDAKAALAARYPSVASWPRHNLFFGGVHGVRRRPDAGFDAAGDPRRDGCAAFA